MKAEYRLVRYATNSSDPDQINYALHRCVVDDNGNVLGRLGDESALLTGRTTDDIIGVLAEALRAFDAPVVDDSFTDRSFGPVYLYNKPETESVITGSDNPEYD